MALAHTQAGILGKNHARRVSSALLDVLFELPIRWFSRAKDLIF